MGPNCKHMILCCENEFSGFEMYFSLSHFRVGFIFQIRMLPVGWISAIVSSLQSHDKNKENTQVFLSVERTVLLIDFHFLTFSEDKYFLTYNTFCHEKVQSSQ